MKMNDIQLAGGGKGGGGSTFREDENTLRSNVFVSTLEAWSEGPIVGPVSGAKSIYLDSTPLQNADNTYNFGGKILWDYRTGLPTQDAMDGFENVSDPVTVNTEVTFSTPVTRTVSDADIDAIGLTISLPQGLYNQNTSDNSLEGTEVELRVDVKLSSSGSWLYARKIKYKDKTTSPYQETFRINRPSGTTGLWDVRLTRLTEDNASSTLRNNTFWAYFTELNKINVTYPNVAYMGIQLDASSVNSTEIPVRSAEIYGLIVKVPNNYNELSRKFTGTWSGTFKNAWTNDPAWVLYDLLTNTRYGLGLDPALVDKYSFYDASVYASETVQFTNSAGLTQWKPRFSFNYQIQNGEVSIELLNKVAGAMNAKLLWIGGQVTVLQDRPTDFSHIFDKSNVIDGVFSYQGTSLQTRATVANVTWNDPTVHYQQRVVSVEASPADIAKYGLTTVNLAKFGCTSQSEAIRYGRWYLDTVLNQTETVTFRTGVYGLNVLPHEVIKVYDERYGGQVMAGRLSAGSTTTVLQLDRAVTIPSGSTVDIQDTTTGTLHKGKAISSTGSNLTSITLSSALSSAPGEYSSFIITKPSLSPRLFRVSSVKLVDETNKIFEITAGVYDPNKYNRVETGVSNAAPVFSSVKDSIVDAPTALTFNERVVYQDGKVLRSLELNFTPSTSKVVTRYQVVYTVANGSLVTGYTSTADFTIPDVVPGIVNVKIFALGYTGQQSEPLVGKYTVDNIESTGSTLDAPTSLTVLGGGTTFTGRALTIKFTNPSSNGEKKVSVSDFKIEVYTSGGGTLLRTEYVPSVAPGAQRTYTYDFDKNLDDGGPRRSVLIKVYCRDGNKKLSLPAQATFTNPAPAALSNFDAVSAIGPVMVTWSRPLDSDFKGVLVWRSTTSGFTPSSANLIADITGAFVTDSNVNAGTVYYYKAAAYDDFERPEDGAGLNIVSDSVLAASNAGIPSGATLPATGTIGDVFFLTSDEKLYRYTSTGWTAAVPTVDLVGTITSEQIGVHEIQNINLDIGVVEQVNLADNSVGSDQLIASSVDTAAIADLSIITSKLADLNVTTGKIADFAITADKIAAGAITANALAITAGGGNLLGNSSFENYDPSYLLGTYADPCWTGWRGLAAGAPSNANIFAETSLQPYGTLAIGMKATTSTSSLFGIKTDPSYDTPYGGIGTLNGANNISGGVKTLVAEQAVVGGVYHVSVYAAKKNGAGFTNLKLQLNGVDASTLATVTDLANPTVTTSWQRYRFKLVMTAATVLNSLSIGVQGSVVAGDCIFFDNLIFERSDISVDWSPRVEELVPGSIISTYLQAGAVTAGKIAASAVTADTIAANAITADKIAANAIDASKLTITDLTNYVSGGTFSNSTGNASFADWYEPGVATGKYSAVNTGGPVSPPNANYMQVLPYSGSSPVFAQALNKLVFDVNNTDPIVVTYYMARTAGTFTAGSFQPIITLIGGGDLSWSADAIPNPTTAWVKYTVTFTPTGTLKTGRASFGFSRNSNSNTPSIFVTGIEVRKKNAGQLIVDGAITTNLIQAGAVVADKIAANTITGDKIAANTITASKIAADTITADKIAANAITASEIAANAITTDKLAANAITADKIAANSITSAQIAANTITANEIAANAITASELAADSVTAGKIAASAVSTNELAANAVTAAKIAANTITAAQIAAGAITATELAADSVTTAKIAAGAVTANEIEANTITTDRLVANAATVAAAAGATGSFVTFSGTANNYETSKLDVVTLTSTGSPVTVTGYIHCSWELYNSSLAVMRLRYRLWVDSTTMLDEAEVVVNTVPNYFGDRDVWHQVPVTARHTPTAASHTYSVQVLGVFYDTSGGLVAAGSGSGVEISGTLVAQENKV